MVKQIGNIDYILTQVEGAGLLLQTWTITASRWSNLTIQDKMVRLEIRWNPWMQLTYIAD
jgi:hypothetical protein